MKRLGALVLAALVMIAAVFAGGLGFARHLDGGDGRWLLLASVFGISLVIALSRGCDGTPNLDERTFFVIFAGGLVGLALVAMQPDAILVVALGITGVSLVTIRGTPMKPCAACAKSIRAVAQKCRYCGELQ